LVWVKKVDVEQITLLSEAKGWNVEVIPEIDHHSA
jgi:hypothetical protein